MATLNANGGPVTIGGTAGFTNTGAVNVNAGTLVFATPYTQTSGTLSLLGGSVQSLIPLNLQGGMVVGAGNIFADVLNGGIIQPSLGGSGLSITGNVSLLSGSQLVFHLGGLTQGSQYGFLNVNGSLILGGNLVVSFANGFQNSVANGNTFTLISTSGGLTGAFANIVSGGRLNTSDGFGSFLVTYAGGTLLLTNFLPFTSASANWLGGVGNWSDATKWSTNPLFPNNGNGGSIFDATLSSGSLTQDIVGGVVIQRFDFSGGSLAVNNPLTTNALFNWTGGSLSGTSVLTLAGGGSLSGTSDRTLANGTLVVPPGQTLTDSGAHNFYLNAGGVLNNAGTFLAQNDNGINANFGSGSVINSGTFTRNTGTGTYQIVDAFTNSGTVNANSGVLGFGNTMNSTGTLAANGGTMILSNGGTISGAFSVAAGSLINLSGGNFTLATGVSSAGAGALMISGANVIVTGNATFAAPLTVGSGTLDIGSGLTLNQTGAFTWTGGVLGGSGGTLLAAGGGNISGTSDRTLANGILAISAGQTLTDSGAHNFYLNAGGVLNNAGTFLAQNDNGINANFGSGSVINSGTFTRNTGTGTYQIVDAFTNSGTVNANSGILGFGNTMNSTGTLAANGGTMILSNGGTISGAFNVAAGSLINLSGGNFTLASGVSSAGAGTLMISGANVTVTGNATFAAPLAFGSGALDIGSGVTLSQSGTFAWTGGTLGGSGGTLQVAGGGTISGTSDRTLANGTLG